MARPLTGIEEIGASGLVTFNGYIMEEPVRELSRDRWRRYRREMIENDPVVGAIRLAIENIVRDVDWYVAAGSESEKDKQAAQFVSEALFEDMEKPWEDTLSDLLSFLWYGFGLFNHVYKLREGYSRDPSKSSQYDDGRYGWGGWKPRSADTIERWILDDAGNPRAAVQIAPPGYKEVPLPLEYMIHLRTTAAGGNPEGRSLIRNAWRPWYFKSRIENIEGIGVERDLAGVPVAKVPPQILAVDAKPEEVHLRTEITKIVQNLKRDEQEGIVFPLAYDQQGRELYKLELLSSGGSRQFDTSAIINRYDQRIAASTLADFILMGQQSVGSYALIKGKRTMFNVSLEVWLDVIANTVNQQPIPRLLRLNKMDYDNPPKLQHGDIGEVDLAALAAYITAISGAGITIGQMQDVVQYLLKQGGMPTVADRLAVGVDQTDVDKPGEGGDELPTDGGKSTTTTTPPAAPPAEGFTEDGGEVIYQDEEIRVVLR